MCSPAKNNFLSTLFANQSYTFDFAFIPGYEYEPKVYSLLFHLVLNIEVGSLDIYQADLNPLRGEGIPYWFMGADFRHSRANDGAQGLKSRRRCEAALARMVSSFDLPGHQPRAVVGAQVVTLVHADPSDRYRSFAGLLASLVLGSFDPDTLLGEVVKLLSSGFADEVVAQQLAAHVVALLPAAAHRALNSGTVFDSGSVHALFARAPDSTRPHLVHHALDHGAAQSIAVSGCVLGDTA